MKQTKCEAVRGELEELMLGDECSLGATQHLRECGDCREFHQQQSKLRQIVGSLGTVEAPPDFDFRLRARLANESGSAGFHLRTLHWSFAGKGFAAATMVLLFVGGVVYVRTLVKQPAEMQVAEQRNQPDQSTRQVAEPAAKPAEDKVIAHDEITTVASNSGPRRVTLDRRVPSRTKAPLVALDRASEGASVISSLPHQSAMFPIEASLQSMRFSFDDGRGNARTISVPTITFGSQRVLPGANQISQKGVGVW